MDTSHTLKPVKPDSSVASYSPLSVNDSVFRTMVRDNLCFIEKQCRKSCGGQPDGHFSYLDVDTLFTEVLDRLADDNYRVIREFRGQAKITTYITVIISNIVIDTVRKHRGRDRSGERARKMGVIGEQLHDLVLGKGYDLHDACESIRVTFGHSITLEQAGEMVAAMQGRSKTQVESVSSTWDGVRLTTFVDEEGVITVPDTTSDPEQRLGEQQREQRAAYAVGEVMEGLSGEERLMLTMRYPVHDGEEPKDISEIAAVFNCTAKAADGRIRRILTRCREVLLKKGVGLKDLVVT